jgi:hypothetical protein
MPQGLEAGNQGRCSQFDQYGILRDPITRETHSGFWHWQIILGKPPTVRTGEEASLIQADYKVKAVIDWWLSQAATLQPDRPSRDRPDGNDQPN